MGILRIASLTAICAVALIDSAYAGVCSCARPDCWCWHPRLDRWRPLRFSLGIDNGNSFFN